LEANGDQPPAPGAGGANDNTLTGTDGADTLNDVPDSNILSAGLCDDLFVFQNSGGDNTITDFTAGAGSDDRIDISAFGFCTFADVLAAADLGTDVTIQLDADDSVILLGVQAADLHSDDFII
jgi:Ca2+-binding RTX toxin-like protein